MSDFVVNIKCSEKSKAKWQSILSIFKSVKVQCSRLNETKVGFKAFMVRQVDVEALFSDVSSKKLEALDCVPLKPNFLRTNRTVIVKNVDRYIMELSEGELIEEINNSNEHVKATSAFKFPSGKTFKFECQSTEMAQNCLDHGLLLFNLSIGPFFLSLEES